jgi:hypothetical protein
MDENDILEVFKKLRDDLKLIDQKRNPPRHKNICSVCRFEANKNDMVVEYNPKGLDLLNTKELFWVILHEEGHLQQELSEKKKLIKSNQLLINFLPRAILYCVILYGILIVFPYLRSFYFLFFVGLVVGWVPMYLFYFRERYSKASRADEDYADDFAAEKLLQERSKLHLIPSEVMALHFKSVRNCPKGSKFCRIKNGIRKLFLGKSHRPDFDRVARVKELFEKSISSE